MRNSFFKRSVAILLAVVLAVPGNITALADTADAVTSVQGERLASGSDSELSEGSRVYFGTQSYNVDEENRTYKFSIFRDGDLSEGEFVTVHSLDLTAKYGEDYILSGNVEEIDGDGRTLLEIASTTTDEKVAGMEVEYDPETDTVTFGDIASEVYQAEETAEEDAAAETENKTDEVNIIEAEDTMLENNGAENSVTAGEDSDIKILSEEDEEFAVESEEVAEAAEDEEFAVESEEAAEAAEAEENEETIDSDTKAETKTDIETGVETETETDTEVVVLGADGKISLADLKELKTGEESRTAESSLNGKLADAISEAISPELFRGIQYSGELRVYFAGGQSEKQISLKILDDDISEGSEMLTLMIVDAECSEIAAPSGLSVTINDDEEYIPSEISFTSDTYETENGIAKIVLERTGQEQSLVSAVVTASDRETGEETILGEAVFTPYSDTVEMEVSYEGEADIALTEISGAEGGDIIEAKLLGEEEPADKSFTITVNEQKYTVKKESTDVESSAIWDERYTPALEVGRYYYPVPEELGGSFSYYTGGDGASAKYAEYLADEHCAHMHYYSKTTGHEGYAAISNKDNSRINPIYYQYILPDWEQTHHRFGGQRSYFNVNDRTWYKGSDFSRECTFGGDGGGCAYQIKNKKDNLELTVEARDVEGNKTPDIEIYLYGFPAMYKFYNVTKENPDNLRYIIGLNNDGTYSYADFLPANSAIKCGAQVLGDTNSMNVYANEDPDKSNLVVTLSDGNLANAPQGSAIFGKIKGYRITVSPDLKPEEKVDLNYPEDFITFLESRIDAIEKSFGGVKKFKSIMNAATSVYKNEISKVNNDYGTVPFDKLFIEWLESKQITVYAGTGAAYYQKLLFKPVFDFNEVKINVYEPSLGSEFGRFTDKNLVANKSLTYHAGDRLTLTATDIPAGYRMDGYEVSTDGGKNFNLIRDTDNLLLQPNNEYCIRPNIIEGSLCIEIKSDIPSSEIDIQGLVPQTVLKGTEFAGRKILDINPEEKNIYARIRPVVGEVYEINAILKSDEDASGKVKRLTFYDAMTKQTYGGDAYYFEARSKAADNVITIGTKSIPESDIVYASVRGYAYMKSAPIRDDAMGMRELPLEGYQVRFASLHRADSENPQTYVGSVTSLIEGDGYYKTDSFRLAKNEMITAIVGNGLNDAQVFYVSTGNLNTELYSGVFDLTYPYSAPEIVQLDYDYDNIVNASKVDLRDTTVRCFENDNLTLRAIVNPKGRTIKKVVFNVYHADGSSDNVKSHTYTAVPETEGSNVFIAKINDMTNSLYNGDYMNVYIVDDETIPGFDSLEIRYPSRRTGLKFYVQNELIKPKNLDVSMADQDIWGTNPEPSVDVPLFGPVNSASQSGTMFLQRVNWPDGNGYSLMLNFDALIRNDLREYSIQDKLKMKDQYNNIVGNLNSYKETGNVIAQDVHEYLNDPEAHETPGSDHNASIDKWAEDSLDVMMRLDDKAKEEVQTLNKDPKMNFRVIFCLDLEFVKKPDDGYVLAMCTVTIGGTFAISQTYYSVIAFTPVFLNWVVTAQVNVMMGGACPAGKNAVKEGAFNGYSGNITKQIVDKNTFVAEMDVVVGGKISIGAGLAGVLSAKGYADIAFKLTTMTANMNPLGQRWGTLLSAKGGLAFDLLLFSIEVNIVTGVWGEGVHRGKSKVSFLNDNFVKSGGMLGASNGVGKSTEPDNKYDGDMPQIDEYIDSETYEAGANVADKFIKRKPLTGQLEAVKKTVLMRDTADRVRPRITELSDGRLFMTFLGKRPGEGDSMCLFYNITDAKGNWGTPQPVYDDKTFDAQSDVIRVGSGADEKVVITWIDASEQVEGLDDYKAQLDALAVSAVIYDVTTDTMGDRIRITGNGVKVDNKLYPDNYLNCNPHLSTDGKKVLCTFITRDIDEAESIERLTDVVNLYSTVRRTTIDPYEGTATEPEFITVEYHGDKTDPLVLDYCTVGYEPGEDSYIISAWSVDMDADYTTSDDRQVYLMLTDRNDDNRTYFPLRVAADCKGSTAVKLNAFGDEVYLSWISDGEVMNIAPLSEVIEDIFHSEKYAPAEVSEEEINKYRAITSLFAANSSDRNWISKAAQTPIFTEHRGDGEYLQYEDTLYSLLAKGRIPHVSRSLKDGNGVSGSISDYSLAYDGNHVYVFYTDYTADLHKNGKELFGVTYYDGHTEASGSNAGQGVSEASGSDAESEEVVNNEKSYLSKPVRITDYGLLMDEFDIIMRENHSTVMVTDCMRQEIDEENGGMIYSDKVLAELDFEPVGSIVPIEESVDITGNLAPGETAFVTVDIENNGLLDAEGADVNFSLEKDGAVIKSGTVQCTGILESGEKDSITVPFKVPEDISNTKIVITAVETGAIKYKSNTVSKYLEYDENIQIDVSETTVNDGKLYVDGILSNIGNAEAEAFALRLLRDNGEAEEIVVYELNEDGMEPGESRSFEMSFDIKPEDFTAFGQIKLEIQAVRGSEVIRSFATAYTSSEPVIAEIEAEDNVRVVGGSPLKLSATAAPWGEYSGDAVFFTDNPSVVSVTKDGTVKALKNGIAKVYAYYPASGLKDSVMVTAEAGNYTPTRSYSSGSSSKYTSGPASAKKLSGAWINNADGSWSFRNDTGELFKGWGYEKVGSNVEYYHVGDDGIMDTGWYYDPKERNWYYLNEKHDGRFGAMMRGWIKDSQDGKWYYLDPQGGVMRTGWIKDTDGKWYYLSPGNETLTWVQDASGRWIYTGKGRPAGSMYAAEKTPDGYMVGADGAWTGK